MFLPAARCQLFLQLHFSFTRPILRLMQRKYLASGLGQLWRNLSDCSVSLKKNQALTDVLPREGANKTFKNLS